MPTTPNMNLLLPSPTITPGPTYASENNTAFDTIDSHDHTSGKGVPVPSAGLNINADLTFAEFNATNLRSCQLFNNSSLLALPADITCLFAKGGDLYYNNAAGQHVQITLGAALNATVIGGIGGDYTTSTALEFYTALSRTFTFWSAPNVPANLDAGSITIRQIALSPNGITLASPNSLASSYTLTLPTALPTTTSAVSVDTSGNVILAGGVSPIGSITMYGGASAPTGWLICDGTSYLRASFPALFTAIGTSYGSADGTHFNVPDFRGMFPRGVDPTGVNDPDYLTRTVPTGSSNPSNAVGSTQPFQIQSHLHSYTIVSTSGASAHTFFQGGGIIGSQNTDNTGGNQTNPVNVYVNFIIKT